SVVRQPPAAVTMVYVSDITLEGNDVHHFLQLIDENTKLLLQDDTDSNVYYLYDVQSPPPAEGISAPSGVTAIPVTWIEGAGTITNNESILLGIVSQAQ